ncbi:hypothetical protein [Streptomyces sp. NPDC097610]|uniref:hypothetical protein n=1 Tax=Streptomyces sp. NPDC097610 TaxID=3157227 RepID=UPI00331A12E8
MESTTGALGQGVATPAGTAIAGQWLAARYHRDDCTVFDFERADRALPHAQGLGGATWRRTSPCSSG